ncbi:hypothetical protein PCE1_002199 [Barthelona sp. PCE]
MVKISQLLGAIEKFAPKRYAEDWDNVGLQFGHLDTEISGILFALDLRDEVIDEAIERGYNVIVTHHPVIFKAMKNIVSSNPTSARILRCIENSIAVLSFHTNLDSCVGGLCDYLFVRLFGYPEKPVVPIKDAPARFFTRTKPRHDSIMDEHVQFTIADELSHGSDVMMQPGCGRVGKLREPMLFGEMCNLVKEFRNNVSETAAKANPMRVIGDQQRVIEKVAIITGSGGSMLSKVNRHGVDAFITGDITYHVAQQCEDEGICLIDAGHFITETVYMRFFSSFIGFKFPEIRKGISALIHTPFDVYE